jgi:hypothetical protein
VVPAKPPIPGGVVLVKDVAPSAAPPPAAPPLSRR